MHCVDLSRCVLVRGRDVTPSFPDPLTKPQASPRRCSVGDLDGEESRDMGGKRGGTVADTM